MEKTTPAGKQLLLKDQLLARDYRELRHLQERSFNMTIDVATNKPTINTVNLGDTMIAQEEMMIKLAVLSYDGLQENIVNRLLDGSPQEYEFVLNEAQKIVTLPKGQE